jgi:dTDP-4-amino-4,6-dideoxygalactose transaminase
MADQIQLDFGEDLTVDLRTGHSSPSNGPRTDVSFVDLVGSHEPLVEDILSSWEQILRTGAFTGGPEVEAFESEFAAYVGSAECVAVGSGTDALVLALRAMGLQPGDEVITVPHTFIATAQAIVEAGGRPVFIDVDPDTGTMDPSRIEAAISARTRAVLPVHLYGHPADMDAILDLCEHYRLQMLQDACQAHGASYRGRRIGSKGTAAFSFYPSKNLGACGNGGAVTTEDSALAERIRMLRSHGEAGRYIHEMGGVNSRLDALQAAALRIKLRHLDDFVAARRRWAARYAELLAGTELRLPVERPPSAHAYHLYVVRHPSRDSLRLALAEAGIETGLHYPIPIHLQGAFRTLEIQPGRFPRSELWAMHGLSLPMYPELTEQAVVQVATTVAEVLESQRVPAQRPA